MLPRGHAGIGMILSVCLILVIESTTKFTTDIFHIFAIITVSYSLFPDIDAFKLSILEILEHRGLTHTIPFIMFVTLTQAICLVTLRYSTGLVTVGEILVFSLCTFSGMLSHVAADKISSRTSIINPEGQINSSAIYIGMGVSLLALSFT